MNGFVTVTSLTPIRVLAIPLTTFCGSLEVQSPPRCMARHVTLRLCAFQHAAMLASFQPNSLLSGAGDTHKPYHE